MTLFAVGPRRGKSSTQARGRTLMPGSRHAAASLPSWRRTRARLCIVICLSCLTSCAGQQFPPAGTISSRALSGADVAGTTVTAARKQNWNCQRIEQAIKNLIAAMHEAKARAEKHQEQAAPTLLQMLARMSGPPGAGNPALGDFQKARRDADQLNDLLRERGCATRSIVVAPPRFSKR
jgi:hypothetical protein